MLFELTESVTFDLADVMLMRVTPESFARAVGAVNHGPYRGLSSSSPHEIAWAFSAAAERIAAVDGVVGRSESLLLERFVTALTSPQARGA